MNLIEQALRNNAYLNHLTKESNMNNKFEVDDLVVLNGQSDVMRVLETCYDKLGDPETTNTVHVAIGNDDGDDWFRADELTLVPNALDGDEEFMQPQQENTPTLTYEQINEEICKMFVQVGNYMNASLDGERITLSIECDDFDPSSSNVDISFKAKVRYNDPVVSNDLNKSAKIAVQRYTEDEGLKPLSIPTYK